MRRKKQMSRAAHEAEHFITWVQPGLLEGTIAFCNFCLRACLHGGGGPQVGEVTRLGGVTRLSI